MEITLQRSGTGEALEVRDASIYWGQVSVRICHSGLDPQDVAKKLSSTPSMAFRPGESKVRHRESRSAGYVVFSYRIEAPGLMGELIEWANAFVSTHDDHFRHMLESDCDVDVYLGIHTSKMTLGFGLPPAPALWSLGIPISMEFFYASRPRNS